MLDLKNGSHLHDLSRLFCRGRVPILSFISTDLSTTVQTINQLNLDPHTTFGSRIVDRWCCSRCFSYLQDAISSTFLCWSLGVTLVVAVCDYIFLDIMGWSLICCWSLIVITHYSVSCVWFVHSNIIPSHLFFDSTAICLNVFFISAVRGDFLFRIVRSCCRVSTLCPSHETRAKSDVFRPRHVLNLSHTLEVPSCAFKASFYPHWKSTMIDQYNALLIKLTWELVMFQSSMNLVGYKWVFNLTDNSVEFIERFKSRLVARGYTQ